METKIQPYFYVDGPNITALVKEEFNGSKTTIHYFCFQDMVKINLKKISDYEDLYGKYNLFIKELKVAIESVDVPEDLSTKEKGFSHLLNLQESIKKVENFDVFTCNFNMRNTLNLKDTYFLYLNS